MLDFFFLGDQISVCWGGIRGGRGGRQGCVKQNVVSSALELKVHGQAEQAGGVGVLVTNFLCYCFSS